MIAFTLKTFLNHRGAKDAEIDCYHRGAESTEKKIREEFLC